ncbi:MAG: FG-GAP-like repeat-containing protein [Bryobacteraceae bacterium]
MKRYWKRLLLLTCAPVLLWLVVHAQSSPGSAPFAFTQFIQGIDPLNVVPNVVLLARKGDNTYAQIGYRSDAPFSLFSSLDTLNDLLSGGFDTFINGPAGPANVGRASQPVAGGKFTASGTPGVALVGNGGVTVYMGSSSLLFTDSTNYALGDRASQVVSADFTGDNAPDLALIYQQGASRRVAVLANQGGGTFDAPVNYIVGTNPAGLASYDMNRDGRNDLIVVGDSSVSILFGNANGTFQNPVTYAGGVGGRSVTAADVNGDGFPDLAEVSSDQSVTILLNNGNGVFRAGGSFQTGAGPVYIAAGDFNNDTRMDLATANQTDGTISVFAGLGNGSFLLSTNYNVTIKAASLVLTDYDRDGNLDILNGYGDARMIGAGDDNVNIDILYGNGDGSFRGLSSANATTGTASTFATIADFNGDGIPDSVVGDFFGTGGKNLYYFAGRANGVFNAPSAISMGAGQVQVKAGASGDFDGDGRPDLAVTTGVINILINNGTGFNNPTTISSGGVGANAIASADLNGDGALDLAVVNSGSGNTAIFLGGGNGTFQLSQTYNTGANPSRIAIADVNGDQKPDLLVTVPGNNQTSVPGSVFVLVNNGNGTFQTPTSFLAGVYPVQAAAGDTNGDGKADLIVSTLDGAFAGRVAVLRGNGNGTFQTASLFNTPSTPVGLAVSDFNADGKLDIVVPQCCDTANLAYFAGNGDGTFGSVIGVNAGQAQVQIQTADLNRDGRQDLVILANPMILRTMLNTSPAVTTACSYLVAPPVVTATSAGGTLTVSVQTTGSCPWATTGLPNWVTISGAGAANGSGTVTLLVARNTGAARTATILIAGTAYTITQFAPNDCVYDITPGAQAFPAAGGTQTITILTSPTCSWSVLGAPNWISFPDVTAGIGSGVITYKAGLNTGAARTAGMFLAGNVFTLEQAAGTTTGMSNQGSLTHLTSAGTWKMTMNYINTATTAAKARFSFFDDFGEPLSIPVNFPQLTVTAPPIQTTVLDRTVDPGAQLILESTGPDSQPTAIGSAQLLATPGVAGFGIFSNPALKWEALVPLETRTTSTYLLAFDNTGNLATGLAVANQTGSPVTVSVLIRDDAGNSIDNQQINLPPRGHSSFMLNQRYASTAGRRGTVQFDTAAAGAISVLGLRANGSALTTLPVMANVGGGGGTIAHSTFNGGFATTFTLVNTGDAPAPTGLNFFDDNGNALGVPVFFPQTGTSTTASTISRTLAPHSILVVETRGSDALPAVTGGATISTNGPVSGFAIFRWIPFGQEASVPMETRVVPAFLLPFDNTGALVTGVGIANGGGASATVSIILRSDSGSLIQTGSIDLPAQGHRSFLLAEIFPGTKNRRGTVEFGVPLGRGVSIIGLRAKSDGTLTTVPVLTR